MNVKSVGKYGNWLLKVKETGGWGEDWIDLAQDINKWRALVSTSYKNFCFLNAGNFFTS